MLLTLLIYLNIHDFLNLRITILCHIFALRHTYNSIKCKKNIKYIKPHFYFNIESKKIQYTEKQRTIKS